MKRFQFNFEEIDENNSTFDGQMFSELSVHLNDFATWREVLNFFAHFLEGVGYIDVIKKLDNLGVFYDDNKVELDDETLGNS